jgi:hypothetical protein
MSIILQCDGLLENMTGTVYGGQVKGKPACFEQNFALSSFSEL